MIRITPQVTTAEVTREKGKDGEYSKEDGRHTSKPHILVVLTSSSFAEFCVTYLGRLRINVVTQITLPILPLIFVIIIVKINHEIYP